MNSGTTNGRASATRKRAKGGSRPMIATRALRSMIALPLAALAAEARATPIAPAAAGWTQQQDTVEIRGVRVEMPRPTATTGGTSAVEVSVDSAVTLAAPTMEEFLRRMPLIQIRANSRGEAQPALRGAEDRQIAILLDGIPLTLGWDHRTDMSVIPLTAVRKLTLLRGLSSMLHGPNVLGGALEFDVARGADQQSPPPPFSGGVSLDQTGGTSASARAGAFLERDHSSWVVRAGGGRQQRDGVPLPDGAASDPKLQDYYLAGDDGLRLNSDRRIADGFVSARYRSDEGPWSSVLFSISDARRGVPPEAHASLARLWRYPNQRRLFVAISGGAGERRTDLGEGDVEMSLGLDRSTTEIAEYASPAYQDVVDGETGRTTTVTGRLLGDHLFLNKAELRSAATFADVTHTESFPWGQALDYRQRLWSLGVEVEVGAGMGGDNGDGVGSGARAAYQTRWTVGASVDGASTPLSGDKERLGTMWDWGLRAGATRAARGGNLQYNAGVSRRTRFPSLRELYSGALGRFAPNPALSPENLIAAEVGVTLTAGNASFQAVGFHHYLRDGIARMLVYTPEGTKFQRVNRDQVSSTGLELLAAGTRGRLTFGGDLTLQRVRVEDPERPDEDLQAEYEPAAAGNLRLTLAVPGDVALTGAVRFRGNQFCQNPDIVGPDSLDSSATLDLEARRAFYSGSRPGSVAGRGLAAAVILSNVSDATVMDQCGLPQPGRTLRIQVSMW